MAKDQIAKDIELLRERLVEKVPSHFSMRHVITAFFGALFFAFSIVLSSLLLRVSLALTNYELVLITISTWLIVTAEIYFVGYTRVRDKEERPFGQFWFKRIVTYYCIAVFTSFLLLSLYGITLMVGTPENVLKLVVAVSLPASIGAALSDLLGKY